jgi:hypothetical protein
MGAPKHIGNRNYNCWASTKVRLGRNHKNASMGADSAVAGTDRMCVSASRNRARCARPNGGIAESASSRLHGSARHEGGRRCDRSMGLCLWQWNDSHRCELWALRWFGRQHQPILQCEHRLCERTGFSGQLLWADRRPADCGRTVRIRGRWVCDAEIAKPLRGGFRVAVDSLTICRRIAPAVDFLIATVLSWPAGRLWGWVHGF